MMKRTMFFRGAVFAIVATTTLFATQSASASTISVTDPAGFTSPVTVVSCCGGSITIDDFLVTNTTTTTPSTGKNPNSYSVDIESIAATIGAHSNDPAETVTSVTDSGGTCTVGTNLAEGSSCTIDLTIFFTAGPNALGHPNPFGSNDIKLTVDGTNPQGAAGNTADDSQTFKTTVDYVAPEPGSLLLFGTGMLGLAGVLRRKLGRG